MFDFNALSEFSRNHCIGICAFLVPSILLLTLQTIILTALHQHAHWVRLSAFLVTICGVLMILHVITWFLVGVVMAPTFILLYMATTCFMINMWAIAHPQSLTPIVAISVNSKQ